MLTFNRSTLEPYLAMPRAAVLLAALALGSLGFVLIMQFGFGLQPCILCLWQRVPFVVVAVLMVIAYLWRPYGRKTSVIFYVATAAFLINAGVAIFHSGVELHWWLGTSSCSIQPLNAPAASVEDLRTQLLHTVTARCDEIAWTFLGLSMANWNVPYSLFLALLAATVAQRNRGI